MLFIWYCFDDHLAQTFHNPDVGHIAWWIILLAQLATMNMSGIATLSRS